MAKFKNPANRINSEYPSASAPYVPTTTSPVSNTKKVHLSGAKQVHEGNAAHYHVELDLSPIGKANSSAALLKALSDLQGKSILFGQQHAIDEGISSTDSHGHRSDVHAMTGKYPAVFGFDTDEPPVETDGSPDATGKAFAKAFIEADSLGSVVTLSSHLHNPVSDGEAFDIDSSVAVDRLLPGGDLNHKITDWLDTVATAANNSIRGDGSKIPIIFRPLHENTGDWFWWGKGHMSADDFKALWQYVHDYLTETKGVDNLLFAYSPNYPLDGSKENYLATYPGDKYVDIMGYDAYQSDNDQPDADWMQDTVRDLVMVNQLAAEHGKVSALTEFGLDNDRVIQRSGNQNIHFFSQFLDAIQANPEAAKFAYMMTWANWGDNTDDGKFQSYTPWPGHEMEADFKNFANRLTLANPANEDVTVTVTIEHGSSDSADLNISTQQVTIRKGESGADFTIDALKDGKAEGNENYTVKISNVQGADIGRGEVQTTIVDADSHYIMHEDFSNRAIGTDYTADTNSGWKNAYHSGSAKIIDRGNGNKALEITSDKNVSALITGPEAGANFEYSGTLSTGTQLGGNNAQAWETARAVWGYRDVDNYYYFIPKANGWELGKRDATAPDGVRYLATGSEPSFAPDADKHFTVIQNGGKMRVLINGQEIVTFEDSQNPFIGGKVGLQASNARIIADDLSLKTVAEHSLPDNHVGHVSISGEAKVGETLTAHVTDGDNFAHDNVFYIWYADNVRIEGVSGNTLTLGKAQQGKSITVQAIYTDAHGVTETPVSAPTTKIRSDYIMQEDFSSYNAGEDYAVNSSWKNAYNSGSAKIIDRGNGNKALEITSDKNVSALITGPEAGANFEYSGTLSTGTQLGGNNAQAWETARAVWGYRDVDNYYYFIPKANGWELGKRDATAPDGVRYLATGSEPSFAPDADKHFTVIQNGGKMRVLINGQEIVTFEDSQNPFIGGKVGLQASNARIIADDLSLKTVAEHSLPDNHVGHVSISGEAKVGETLTAHVTDGDNFAHDNVFYIWYADNVRIEGVSGNTLTLGKAQQGKSITVQAIYTDAHGVTETPVSAPSTKVGNSGYLLYDDFSSHKLHSTYSDQETFGDWKVAHAGYGKVEIIDNGGGNQALQLGPMVRSGETDTSSSMVVSTVQTGDTFTYSGTIATPEQLRQNAPPHAWETAWLVWNYTDNDHYYYFVPRANGWELGKRDPAYKGGQRFMATGSESWPLAEAKDFVISKHGNTVEISINGKVITTFTDDERPYTGGSIGLYTEDARIIADDIHLTPTANITGTANHGGIAAISGTAATGAVLQAAIHDSDGVQGNISYQWMVAGKEIPGATDASYAITPENSGKSITVRITYTDNTGKVESVISPPTAVVDSGNDGGANHPGQVTLHGRAAIGETLTTTVSDADGMPEIIQYTWMADGKAIEGANSSSYTITAADVGKVISVQAYYYDNAGHEEVVLSNATGTVTYFSAAANPENGDLTHPVHVIDTTPAFPTLVPHNSDGEYNPSGEGVNLGTIAPHEQTLNLDLSAPSHTDNGSAVQHHNGINATSDGNDSLPDGTNADPSLFHSPFDGTLDTLLDFNAGTGNHIQLNHNAFSGLPKDNLSAEHMAQGAEAKDANDRLIYDQATGELAYDADSSSAAVSIARFGVNSELEQNHIQLI